MPRAGEPRRAVPPPPRSPSTRANRPRPVRAASSGPAGRRTPGAHSKPPSPFQIPASRKPRANSAGGVGYGPIAPSVEIDPVTGGFVRSRRPAHIRALEESKTRNPRPAQVDKALVDKARNACIELRTTLSATAARLDFTQIDRIVLARGDSALAPLRQQIDSLVQLALAFAKFTCGGGALSALEARLNSRPAHGAGGNALRIKTVVVALRALTDKLSSDIEAAASIVEAVEQGLLEQIFSWASEAESTYDILLVARAAPRAPAYPPSQRAPNFARTCSAGRDGRAIGGRALTVGASRAVIESEEARGGKDNSASPPCYRERLGRCRPARLQIPEVPEKKGH